MWDDMTPYIVGDPASPVVTVFDADSNPNNILDATLGGSVEVDWSFTVQPSYGWILPTLQFTASVYVDAINILDNHLLGASNPAAGSGPFSVTIPIAANSLAAGAYRLTTLVTAVDIATGNPTGFAGFSDGPIIQVR